MISGVIRGIVILGRLHEFTDTLSESMAGEEKERESDSLPQTVAQASEDLFVHSGSSSGTGFG